MPGETLRPLVMHRTFVSLFALALVAGCSSKDADAPASDAGADSATGDDTQTDGGTANDVGAVDAGRPYTVNVPTSYDPAKATPLVILLHGYSATGFLQDAYFGLTATSNDKGFLYVHPDGTVDSKGNQFWNATNGCCNFDNSPVDDVAYIDRIIDETSAKYNVDKKRVFLIGHSNGAFMAHRMACDEASRIAAIVSLAGDVWKDPTLCNPTEPVSILQIQGDADQTISYTGGDTGNAASPHPYPGSRDTVATWAAKDKCTGPLAATGQMLDIDTKLAGAETAVEQYSGCPQGIDVILWTIHGGGHIPSLPTTWGDTLWTFLSAHPKP